MRRVLVALSIAAAVSWPVADAFLNGPAWLIVWKGAAVGLLAVAAAISARGVDGWLLALALAIAALGDVVIEQSFVAGAGVFAIAHIVAIVLFVRNRRKTLSGVDGAIAAGLLLTGLLAPSFLLPDGVRVMPYTFYGLLLCGMAAAAQASLFPRTVALGAVLFVISDALLVAQFAIQSAVLSVAVWGLYYLSQLMIFTGVRRSLDGREGRAEASA